ncbi:MAG: T9SS type A sorting domain-containing protein, partial [Bacteroidales bacterium]|nr:T9SS type A sorting domain-containing protein [Bacteroidales bacterium]
MLPNGQSEWINLNNEELVTSIVINSEDEIYVGCSNLDWYIGGARRSMDNGQTWEIINTGMGDQDIANLVLGPEGHLFAVEYYAPTSLYKSVNSTITTYQNYHIGQNNVVTYNYPNPFTTETTIEFFLEEKTYVELYVYNVSGMLIKTLVKKNLKGGNHSIKWCGLDMNHQSCKPGLCIAVLKVNGKVCQSVKLIKLN